jgi:hypothetical protein
VLTATRLLRPVALVALLYSFASLTAGSLAPLGFRVLPSTDECISSTTLVPLPSWESHDQVSTRLSQWASAGPVERRRTHCLSPLLIGRVVGDVADDDGVSGELSKRLQQDVNVVVAIVDVG